MFNQYLLNLYYQYCNAKGINFNAQKEKNFSYDFIKWITINKILIQEYWNYLLYLGYHNGKLIGEIGKGRYDSIQDSKLQVISPYAHTLQLINSNLVNVNGMPLIQKNMDLLYPSVEVFLTHNPYNEIPLESWAKIHNNSQFDISVGMFGSMYDEDFSKKVERIESIAKMMTDDYRFDFDTDKGNYFCTLNSCRKTKIKTLIR